MAKPTSKAPAKTSILRTLFSVLGAILLIALIPAIVVVGAVAVIIGLFVWLLETIGILKKPLRYIYSPRLQRAEAWKPTQRWHRAWSTRACALRHHNKRVKEKPYALARGVKDFDSGEILYFDGRVGEDAERLRHYGLPTFQTPEDIAAWLKIPVRTLAWLGDYHRMNSSEKVKKKQHYHYTWVKKKSGGEHRLIEAPKSILKTVQQRILRELLDRIPPHAAAHGFVKGRSIKSNAAPHVKKYAVLKVDLENFYPNIRYKRVVAIFGGMGFNVEVSHWLARLCTNRLHETMRSPSKEFHGYYYERHLPQGAPTSPALANLAAFPLDVRLSGLAKKFGVAYTRYADDMTFSGDEHIMVGKSMNWLIRYVRGIIRDEKFTWNSKKKKIIRSGHRQIVTGLTVNEKPNVSRPMYEALKATLHNCVRKGPLTQNREKHPDFRAHLQGKVSFVESVNPERARKLRALFGQIKW